MQRTSFPGSDPVSGTHLTPWVIDARIGSMWINGQHINEKLIEKISKAIESEPEISRRELSRRVCEWVGWRSANGKLKEMSCRKVLQELQRRGSIRLPKSEKTYGFQNINVEKGQVLPWVKEADCDLSGLGRVEVIPVSSRYSKSSRDWNQLLDGYHYLGRGPLCGAQIRYLIKSEKYGCIGGLSFSGATRKLKAREEWIGWSEGARRQNLEKVVCNSRFLIVPTIRVKNLSSHVLSLSLKRLREDWLKKYKYEIELVETFVDPVRFKGTSYIASNWTKIGETAGRRDGYANGKISSGKKDIYVYPLTKEYRERLCHESPSLLGCGKRLFEPQDWVEEEFGGVELYDGRLKERLFTLARDFYSQPGKLVPQASNGSKAKVKAAYRFFDNGNIDMQVLLKPHIESSIERIKGQSVVLAVQDTTTLTYSHHAVEGMGPVNTKGDRSVGLLVHDTMAFTEDGVPLGLLDVQCWSRKEEEAGKREFRARLPIDQKESIKWLKSYRAVEEVQGLCPDTTLVSVGDREADIYEFFEEAGRNVSGPKLLVRAKRGGGKKSEEASLLEKLLEAPLSGTQELFIPRKGSRRARTAKLGIRFIEIEKRAPRKKANRPSIRMWAVLAKEIEAGENVKDPLEWILLTTVKTETFEDACKRIAWYSKRWGIETYHRTLKSGCRIEDRRLENADRLEACLAIDFVVAWRIFWMTKQGREIPDIPCDVFLSEDEWQVLWIKINKGPIPAKPPSIGQVLPMIGALGGYLNRKGDGPPGTTSMWRGLTRLQSMAEGYALAKRHMQRAGP